MIQSCIIYTICLLLATISIQDVYCQICQRRTMVTIPKQLWYTYTYKATYRTNCWYGNCVKTRIQSRPSYKTITTREMRYIQECCTGFIREDVDIDNDTINCKPICTPSCSNGYCKQPGICACHEGFVTDPTNFYHCLPVCSEACSHGKCIAPETCECDPGYTLNGTCRPICSEPCENGLCSGPDICECLEGYRVSERNRCKPYCFKGCLNGTCIQPEICQCDPGYTKIEDECVPECNECGNGACVAPNVCLCDSGYVFHNDTCQPVCNVSCDNGKCIAPDTCECNTGYTLENNTCQPFCSKVCGMGKCSEPDTCKCYFGYKAIKGCDPYCCGPYCDTDCQYGNCTEDGTCECYDGYRRDDDDEKCIPDCKHDCGNGTCIEPNICKCNPGFKINETTMFVNESLCTPFCQNCEGDCVAPDLCICYPPYERKIETADGTYCDCLLNCSDMSRQCNRTICVLIDKLGTSSVFTSTTSGTTNWNPLVQIDWALTEEANNTTPIFLLNQNSSTVNDMTTGVFNATIEPIRDNNTKLNQANKAASKGKTQWSFPVWIYVVISVMTILTIIAIILVMKRQSLSNYFNGGSYVIQDHPENITGTSRSIDIRFSSIQKTENCNE